MNITKLLAVAAMLTSGPLPCFAQRSEVLLEKDWKFHRGDAQDAVMTGRTGGLPYVG